MTAVHRTPTPAEVIRHDTYGEPYPDPADLLVELVTARSGAGPVAISDRDIAQRLHLKSTDDALRLVALAVKAGRMAESRDGDRRLLFIPFVAVQPDTASRALVEQVRAAIPPPPSEPRAPRAQPAPFVAPPTREIGPPLLPPPAPDVPAPIQETIVTTTEAVPATATSTARIQEKKVIHLNLTPAWHALFKARADATGVPLNRILIDAAIAGFDGPQAPVPPAISADTAARQVPRHPSVDDIDNLRVPIALFRAAQDAGMTLRALTEEIIAAGWASYQQAQAGEAGR